MTTGLYKNIEPSSSNGLYIRKQDGSVARAELDDDALVVLVGVAGAQWLGARLAVPFRATEHSMYAGFPVSGAEEGTHASRAW